MAQARKPVVNDVAATPALRHSIVTAFLVAILILGVTLRIRNLGGPDFGVDETFHVYAAQRMLAGDLPLLPSGFAYARSLPYTRTVEWAGALLGGVDEWTARVPSVVFGSLSILVVFLIGRQWYGATAGLVAAFVTAVAPMQVAHSRQVRMYALFQLLYLTIIYLVYQGVETSPATGRAWVPRRLAAWCKRLEIRPGLLLVAAPIALIAARTHYLLFPSLAGPAAYIAGMALAAPYMNDTASVLKWKYRGAAALLIAGGLLVFGLNLGSVHAMYAEARFYAPTWAEPHKDNWRFYVYALGGTYPTIFGSFMLACAFALTRNLKATLYILACLTAPFLLHSFFFAWKEDRYLLHVMPFMFIVFSVAVSALLRNLYVSVTAWAARALRANPQVIGAGVTLIAVIFTFGATRELREGVKLHNLDVGVVAGVQHYNWKKAMDFIVARARPSDVIITSRSLATHYYGPNLPLYYLNEQELDSILTTFPRDADGRPLDYATGALVILNVDMLRDVITSHRSGWFVTERPQLRSVSIPVELAKFIERYLAEETVPDAADMAVFSWGHSSRIDADSQ
jgi:4-amino-4-deoxy-L-arabinose transferase-like glycosyltransferase